MKDSFLDEDLPIIGHKTVISFLRTCIKNKKLAHAYLFLGADHVGRRVVAENFIYELLCAGEGKKPCRSCAVCAQIAKGIHPDIFFLAKDEDKKNISIEQVRELQSRLSLGSFLNSYKIAVIDGAENLSIEAANALLKTLEEPSSHSLLILISSSLENLPETVTSRCQVIRFLPVAEKEIFDYLLKRGLSRREAENLAHLSFGRPGIAVNYLKNEEKLKEYKEMVHEFISFGDQDIYERFEVISNLASKKNSNSETVKRLIKRLDIWKTALRDLLLIESQAAEFISNRFTEKALEKLAGRYSIRKLLQLLKNIEQTEQYLKQNVNPRLALENFVIDL